MIKFVVAFIFILFDLVLGVENIQFDLLPDFIGYAVLVYGIWRMQKRHGENLEFQPVAKQGILLFAASAVVTYLCCILDLYGVISDMGVYAAWAAALVSDILGILAIYMYIRLLTGLQGMNRQFQVKRINTLLMVKVLCTACQYVAITFAVSEFAMTFQIFEMVVNLMILVYMTTSAFTYKEKYMQNNA
ncbi:MAG: hypothetical protein HFI34_10965 [Lachnospiraceae bacterium]|nr:hypothetical protein [Lachnospiraceae bacterium]